MSQTLGEIMPSTADSIWIATARLHVQNKDVRDLFTISEIFQEVKNLGFVKVTEQTIHQYISTHCVANVRPSPQDYRYLYRADNARYRLCKPEDRHHYNRKHGKKIPVKESIPHQFRELVDWYNSEYCKKGSNEFQEDSRIYPAPPHERIDGNGMIKIPSEIKEFLCLYNGDYVGFVKTPNGRIQLQKADVSLKFQ